MHLINSLCPKIAISGTKITNNIVVENYVMPNPYLGYELENKKSTFNLMMKKRIFQIDKQTKEKCYIRTVL